MIVMLRGGVIALYEGERITDQMYVAGGFAEVTPERCTVLANEVLAAVDLDRAEEGERRLAEAEAALRRSRRRTSWPRNWRWNAPVRAGAGRGGGRAADGGR